MAIRFKYRRGLSEHNFETLPFYRFRLRGFLRRHLGRAVWLKGSFVGSRDEVPAYLIFYSSLRDRVAELLSEPLENMGFYEMAYVTDPMKVIMKYVRRERSAVGLLKLPSGLKIGSPETLHEELSMPVPVDYRRGFMLTDGYTFIRAGYARLELVPRRNLSSPSEHEYAPMLLLEDATVSTVVDGRVVGESREKNYGVWLELVDEKYLIREPKIEAAPIFASFSGSRASRQARLVEIRKSGLKWEA